jgi:hypothetical protein
MSDWSCDHCNADVSDSAVAVVAVTDRRKDEYGDVQDFEFDLHLCPACAPLFAVPARVWKKEGF